MSVRLGEVAFRNNNNIDVTVGIEAPIGTSVVSGTTAAANQTVKIPVRRDNCASIAIIAKDDEHGEYRQTFTVSAPAPRTGQPAYLESVELQYVIASFSGSFTARTE